MNRIDKPHGETGVTEMLRAPARWPVVKRCLDVGLAALGLGISAPLLLILAVLVWINLGSPIFFGQTRVGRRGRHFTLFKFRTMSEACDDNGALLADHARLGRFGRLLRATSLDELPQLWNVLRGEMSLVGPRPLLPEYTERYTSWQRRRLEVQPGITGWAQVHGRNALSWEARFDMDVWYVDHWSLRLDAQILFQTGLRVIRRDGISAANHETMPEFLGSDASHEHRTVRSQDGNQGDIRCVPW